MTTSEKPDELTPAERRELREELLCLAAEVATSGGRPAMINDVTATAAEFEAFVLGGEDNVDALLERRRKRDWERALLPLAKPEPEQPAPTPEAPAPCRHVPEVGLVPGQEDPPVGALDLRA